MIIFTDNIEHAQQYITNVEWNIVTINEINISLLVQGLNSNVVTILINSLFCEKELYYSKIESETFWSILFIVNNSKFSQFDILDNICSEIDLPDKILCLAGSGKDFHGYRNRHWKAFFGNIHLSCYFSPKAPINYSSPGFSILSSVSVIQAIDSILLLKNSSQIKWINDIFINSSKVGGVLANTHIQGEIIKSVILGIGLNVETKPEFKSNNIISQISCLNDYLCKNEKINRNFIFKKLIKAIELNYYLLLNDNFLNILNIYKERSLVLGKYCYIWSDDANGNSELIHKGKVIEIGDNLELYLDNCQEPITNGRVQLLENNHLNY